MYGVYFFILTTKWGRYFFSDFPEEMIFENMLAPLVEVCPYLIKSILPETLTVCFKTDNEYIQGVRGKLFFFRNVQNFATSFLRT